ncbi:hypothetical protein NIES2100_50630 [Calothrix sp. NIES-2100]|uniref:hypothetical protein n=1 Tax=Calothrix sp. NIES-2100 TaxID=1954172 RepID=UPI000B5ED545|nr:hypothetical protein NIES2100_50630 [Calothrix sp. NIES-2100]
MRQMRLFFIGLVTFFAVISSTFWKRAIAVSLCGVLGANSPACYLVSDGRVAAGEPWAGRPRPYGTTLVAQGVDIFSNDGGGNSVPTQNDIFSNPQPIKSPETDNNQRNQTLPSLNPSVQSIRNEYKSPIYVYYVNGIRTDNTGYADDVNLISSRLLNEIVDPPRIDVPTHNPTGTILLTDSLITRIWKSGFGDFFESLRQILDAPRPDSEVITNKIIEAIKKRDKEKSDEAKKSCEDKKHAKFVIIGHSQGNFFLQDIAQKLPQEFADRTVLLSFASFTHFGRISERIRTFYPLLRPDDFPALSNGVLNLVNTPAGTPNLPSLPTLISYQNHPSFTGTNGLNVKLGQAFDSHSLKNYLGEPTNSDYAVVAQRSLEMARVNLTALLNFDSGKYDKKTDCSSTANQTPQTQLSLSNTLPAKNCKVPKEFFKDKRVVRGIRLDDYICVIKSPVMTKDGFVDGNTACGVCDIWGNYGMPPTKSSCNSRQIDPDRSNEVPTCPENWGG